MTEFRYRIDRIRELVLTGNIWYYHDQGCKPRRWDTATDRERAMLAEIARLRTLLETCPTWLCSDCRDQWTIRAEADRCNSVT